MGSEIIICPAIGGNLTGFYYGTGDVHMKSAIIGGVEVREGNRLRLIAKKIVRGGHKMVE